MSRKFAKLFETSVGQIVVMRMQGDDGPTVRIYFLPEVDGLDICHTGLDFKDDDEGRVLADRAFDILNADEVTRLVSVQVAEIGEMFGGNQ